MGYARRQPLPSATESFPAGEQSRALVEYPKLPRAVPVKAHHVSYPSLSKCPGRKPATHRPMGMTMPIMTKMGGHPLDTATQLPVFGRE
jgi:hypothetical protein